MDLEGGIEGEREPADPAPLRVDRSARTLRELTLDKMREAIWTGHFAMGQRLVERELCAQLDVSRTVVREVLRHLESEGLVERIARDGPAVARITQDQARQIYEIRAVLEGRAARRCAERATDAALERLAAVNQQIQQAFRRGRHREVITHTSTFYRMLFDEAGLGMAADIVESLNARINQLRAMTIGSPGRRQAAAEEMAALIAALNDRNPDHAQQAAEAHVRQVATIAAGLIDAFQPRSASPGPRRRERGIHAAGALRAAKK